MTEFKPSTLCFLEGEYEYLERHDPDYLKDIIATHERDVDISQAIFERLNR